MTTEEKSEIVAEELIDEDESMENDAEEVVEGRSWNRIFIALGFVLVVVILWYVFSI